MNINSQEALQCQKLPELRRALTEDFYERAIAAIKERYKLTPKQVDLIQQVLEKGDRVELIPCKDGVKIIQESRKEVK